MNNCGKKVWIASTVSVATSVFILACGDDTTTTDAGPDATAQDGSAQDGSAQDGSAQDGSAQDGSAQDGSAQDGGANDAATDGTVGDAAGDAASDGAAGDGGAAALCVSTGGTVGTAQCCTNTPDFPNTCAPGPCGCSPQNSHTVQTCQCPSNQCFTQQLGCH